MWDDLRKMWVSWERQRRSIVLSKEVDAKFHEILTRRSGVVRYVNCGHQTVRAVLREKPHILFVQNPSMVLAFMACLMKLFCTNLIVVVDRHSNFSNSTNPLIGSFLRFLSDTTIRMADLTIVTNVFLRELVDSLGGKGFVLEDRIPELSFTEEYRLKGTFNILFVCSFSIDEPVEAIIDAARRIDPCIHIYISGNHNKIKDRSLVDNLPENISLIGYVPDQVYFNYLHSVDAVIVLTDSEHTLTCGAYEGVAAGKPLILSNKRDLIGYFRKGVVPTENDGISLSHAIRGVVSDCDRLRQEIAELRLELAWDWKEKFKGLVNAIESIYEQHDRHGEDKREAIRREV